MRKRPKQSPPWWLRVTFYAATWPTYEGPDLRVELQRRYLRTLNRQGLPAARRMARRQALHYGRDTGERIVRNTLRAARWGLWFLSGG